MASALTPNDVARLLSVSPDTVVRWAKEGLLAHWKTPGGHHRFDEDAVEKFRAEMESAAARTASSEAGPPPLLPVGVVRGTAESTGAPTKTRRTSSAASTHSAASAVPPSESETARASTRAVS